MKDRPRVGVHYPLFDRRVPVVVCERRGLPGLSCMVALAAGFRVPVVPEPERLGCGRW